MRVTVVFPGAIGTNIAVNSGVADSLQVKGGEAPIKMLAPGKAAQIIIDGIEHNRYRVLVGPDARFMDAVYRLNPQRAARFIYNQMRALLPNQANLP